MGSGVESSASGHISNGSRDSKLRGVAYALLAATLWGLSGTAAQFLFQRYSFPPEGMVAIRMPLAGCILYMVFRPKLPRTRLGLFALFSVIGLWAAQSTYLLAISYSNAATATLLQYLFLPMVAAYEMVTGTRPTLLRIVSVVLATVGTVELVAGTTGGTLQLLVTPVAVVIGVSSACTVVVFMLASRPLIREYGSPGLTTWGMLLGSVVAIPTGSYSVIAYALGPLAHAWLDVVGLVFFVGVIGTAIPFLLYFRGLESISPTEAGVASAAEPITAALASFILLHVVLTDFQYLGGALIMGAVSIAALDTRRHSPLAAPDSLK